MIELLKQILDKETDYFKFEKVALEVMEQHGYNGIRPFGGHKDKGVDASLEVFYEGKLREKIIFQFSMDKSSTNKVNNTLKTLKDNKIDYTQLVYVTSKQLRANEKIEIEKKGIEYGVTVVCFDQEMICNYLSRNNGELWLKYYPDPIQMALQNDKDNDLLGENAEYKNEILKAFFLFYKQNQDVKTKNLFIKEFIISFCASKYKVCVPIEDIISAMNEEFKLNTKEEIIRKIVGELTIEKSLSKIGECYLISRDMVTKYLSISDDIGSKINKIGDRIVDKIQNAEGYTICDSDYGKIINITKKYLLEVLKRYSLSIVSSIYNEDNNVYDPEVIVNSGLLYGLDPNLQKLFIYAASEVLSSKDKDIIETLYLLSMSYTSMYALGINPYLHEFYNSKLKGKSFILDTDFILDAIVSDFPENKGCKEIIKRMNSSGASIIIPYECLEECATHAKISWRTYDYFGDSLLSLPEDQVDNLVYNLFVKGYYYAKKKKKHLTFESYINNYYEKNDSIGYLYRLISESYPFIEIKYINDIAKIDEKDDEYIKIYTLLHEQAKKSKKAQYRTESDIEKLSHLDAKIFLAAKSKNGASIRRRPLGLNSYVVTKSFSFNISARLLGIEDNISTTKEALTAYFNMLGTEPINKKELASFIFSPILHFVSTELEDDIKKLAKLGFDLSDCSPTRLSYDIDSIMHSLLEGFNESSPSIQSYIHSDEYSELIRIAKSKGYKLSPIVDALHTEKNAQVARLTSQLDDALARNKVLELQVRRKKRYLKRTKRKH